MLWWLATSIFGLAFMHRTLASIEHQKLLTISQLTKIGTCLNVMSLVCALILHDNGIGCWLYFIAIQIGLLVFTRSLIFARRRAFEKSFTVDLELLILLMRSGKSFRQSLQHITSTSDHRFRRTWEEIWSIVVFSQQASPLHVSPFLARITSEFIKVDRQTHKSLERLRSFRRQIKFENDFRRRSGQAQSQAWMQITVMSSLYLLLLSYVIFEHGVREVLIPFALSIVLFACGMYIVLWMTRRFRWVI